MQMATGHMCHGDPLLRDFIQGSGSPSFMCIALTCRQDCSGCQCGMPAQRHLGLGGEPAQLEVAMCEEGASSGCDWLNKCCLAQVKLIGNALQVCIVQWGCQQAHCCRVALEGF